MKKHPTHNVFVTEDGRVWKNGRWAKLSPRPDGYLVVSVGGRGAPIARVHHLVLETYVGPCPPGLEGRHLDGDPANCRLGNLKWGTRQEQIADQKRHGTFSPPPVHRGSANRGYKGLEENIAKGIQLLLAGRSSRQSAKLCGVSKTHLLRRFRQSGQKEIGGHER